MTDAPIGIFDSGVGGLSILAAVRERLPRESLLYFGDSARMPYGQRAPETVVRYAEEASAYLLGQGAKMIVAACNTVCAYALPHLRRRFPDVPIIGVVEPSARLAAEVATAGRIVVLATEGTVRSGAFETVIRSHRAESRVSSVSCPLLVPLVEEGLVEGSLPEALINHYLACHMGDPVEPVDVVVLGCTHFPFLRPSLARVLGSGVTLVDAATATAAVVAVTLESEGLLCAVPDSGAVRFVTTGSVERFRKTGRQLLPWLFDGPAAVVAQFGDENLDFPSPMSSSDLHAEQRSLAHSAAADGHG